MIPANLTTKKVFDSIPLINLSIRRNAKSTERRIIGMFLANNIYSNILNTFKQPAIIDRFVLNIHLKKMLDLNSTRRYRFIAVNAGDTRTTIPTYFQDCIVTKKYNRFLTCDIKVNGFEHLLKPCIYNEVDYLAEKAELIKDTNFLVTTKAIIPATELLTIQLEQLSKIINRQIVEYKDYAAAIIYSNVQPPRLAEYAQHIPIRTVIHKLELCWDVPCATELEIERTSKILHTLMFRHLNHTQSAGGTLWGSSKRNYGKPFAGNTTSAKCYRKSKHLVRTEQVFNKGFFKGLLKNV